MSCIVPVRDAKVDSKGELVLGIEEALSLRILNFLSCVLF